MSTRSSTRNLVPPLEDPERTIRRTRVDPNPFEEINMATNGAGNDGPPLAGGGDQPVPDLRTMEELCLPTLNGRGGLIAPINIQATNFGLKNDMIQQVQNYCQFHRLPGDDANKHLDKFLHVTQSIKVNGVTDDALRLYLFPHSLTHHATTWFDRLTRNSITTFEQMVKTFLGKYFPPFMVTKLRNEITNFHQRPDKSLFKAWERYKLSIDHCPNHNMLPVTQIHTFYNGLTLRHRDTINAAAREIVALKLEMAEINKNLMKMLQTNQQVKAVTPSCKTCGGPHAYNDCPATVGQTQNVYAAGAYNQGGNSYQPQGTLPSNTVTNPKEDLKGITTRSGVAYKGPTIPTTSSSPPKVVEHETEPFEAPVSAPKPNLKPSIPYPSRLNEQKLREKANNQLEKIFQVFQDLHFDISFADALILMPKFSSTIKSLLTNKEKLFELAKTPLNKHCSAALPKNLPEILGDPGKFLIPCDFPGMDKCLALADLGASINLMPLSVWKKLSLPELTLTCMTLELADRSISRPVGVAEDVFIKVGKRSFLKTGRALIDVYAEELTLHVGNKAVTFNLDQTLRYSSNYDDISVNRIDVIDVACEEYSQEVLGFSVSGNPTPSTEPIVSTSFPTLTPFGDSDFLLEETDAFLAIKDEPISPEIDDSYYDSEGDIILLKEFFNDDPSSPPLPPQELKIVEPKNEKSSIDEPPVVELKDLPPHLEYAFLEGDDKLPIIIAKDLKDEEKAALIKVLKSHKQALAW
ncbi:reverse transcriptase domain-containing protein [Tanacetum coccineum]